MLEIKDFSVKAGADVLLEDINITIDSGNIIGLTGQSGAGKTTLLKSILGILDRTCDVSKGEIIIDEVSLYLMNPEKRRELCGTTIGFIPQNPMTAFDGRVKMKNQIYETLHLRLGLSMQETINISEKLFKDLGLKNPERILDSYPSQLSGGMLQRVTAVLLLALNPQYILADEPTSALDDDNRLLLLELLLKRKTDSGILFISHDVDVLKKLCDTVHVIEHGSITESGTMDTLINNPQRDWTKAFANASKSGEQEEWSWMG